MSQPRLDWTGINDWFPIDNIASDFAAQGRGPIYFESTADETITKARRYASSGRPPPQWLLWDLESVAIRCPDVVDDERRNKAASLRASLPQLQASEREQLLRAAKQFYVREGFDESDSVMPLMDALFAGQVG